MKENIKFISFGAGQCSSVLPFILNDYDHIVFCDIGYELPFTYEWVKIVQKSFPKKFVWLKTHIKQCHPPICTKEGKILPWRRYMRSKGVKQATNILGMTIDEKHRMNESDVKWITNEYPLIKMGMNRKACQKYLLDNFGFVPPRSGCTICKSFDRHHLLHGIKKINTLIGVI